MFTSSDFPNNLNVPIRNNSNYYTVFLFKYFIKIFKAVFIKGDFTLIILCPSFEFFYICTNWIFLLIEIFVALFHPIIQMVVSEWIIYFYIFIHDYPKISIFLKNYLEKIISWPVYDLLINHIMLFPFLSAFSNFFSVHR